MAGHDVNHSRWSPGLTILLVVVAVAWLASQVVAALRVFGDVVLLFALGALIAFILDPAVGLMEKAQVRRGLAVFSIYAAMLVGVGLAVGLLGPALVYQVTRLSEDLPTLAAALPTQAQIADALGRLGLPVHELAAAYEPGDWLRQIERGVALTIQGTLNVATGMVTLAIDLILLAVISFYMLLDGRRLVAGGLSMVPVPYRDEASYFVASVADNFGGFLRGQIIQAVLFGLVVAAAMMVLGLDYVLLATVLSGVLMLVPVLGPVLSLVPPLAVAVPQWPGTFLALLIVLVAIQAIIINVLMPRILSRQMGLHPLLVLLGILIGFRIGGVWGAFFGIPVMGVIASMAGLLLRRWQVEHARCNESPDNYE